MVKLAAAMVGHVDDIDAAGDAAFGVLAGGDAFDDEGWFSGGAVIYPTSNNTHRTFYAKSGAGGGASRG